MFVDDLLKKIYPERAEEIDRIRENAEAYEKQRKAEQEAPKKVLDEFHESPPEWGKNLEDVLNNPKAKILESSVKQNMQDDFEEEDYDDYDDYDDHL